jgi:hypothetical protein
MQLHGYGYPTKDGLYETQTLQNPADIGTGRNGKIEAHEMRE